MSAALSDFNDAAGLLGSAVVRESIVDAIGKQRPASLAPVSLVRLREAMHTPPRYVLPTVPRRVVTLLAAHGGAGKTVLALQLAAHVACGLDFGPWRIDEAGRVLFVSLEDDADLVRYRLQRIADAFGLPHDTLSANMVIVDGTASDTTLAVERSDTGIRTMVPTATYDELATLAVGMDLIVIDNASDAFGGNENERRQVRQFIRLLAKIARDNNAGLLLLAHVDKQTARFGSPSDGYSGSTAWHNSCRSRLALTVTDDGVLLKHEKLNHTKMTAPLALTWSTNGVLVPVTGSSESCNPTTGTTEAEALAIAFRAADKAGEIIPAVRKGPSTAQHVLSTFPELPKVMRGTKGRLIFWTAIARLQHDGRLEVVDYKNSDRKTKRRFALVPCAPHSPTPPAMELAHWRSPCAGSDVCANPHELAQTGATGADDANACRSAPDDEP